LTLAASTPALLYAPLPLLLWASVRFGTSGLSLSVLGIALISIWYTMHGIEAFPFASMRQNVLSLRILLCLVAVPLLFLSAVMSESRRTAEALRNTSGNLIDSQEQERRRISRELHDDLGQELALAMAKLDELREESHPSVQPGLTNLFHQLSSISNTYAPYLGTCSTLSQCQGAWRGIERSILGKHLEGSIGFFGYNYMS
jgi:signal transduction histidine kinase